MVLGLEILSELVSGSFRTGSTCDWQLNQDTKNGRGVYIWITTATQRHDCHLHAIVKMKHLNGKACKALMAEAAASRAPMQYYIHWYCANILLFSQRLWERTDTRSDESNLGLQLIIPSAFWGDWAREKPSVLIAPSVWAQQNRTSLSLLRGPGKLGTTSCQQRSNTSVQSISNLCTSQ